MRRWFAFLSLLVPSLVLGQSVRYQSQVIGSRGVPLANQNVAICSQPANVSITACSPLTTLITSIGTSSGGADPTTTDVNGNFFFYSVPGLYTIQIYGRAISTPFVQPHTSVGTMGASSFTTITVSGAATFTGGITTNAASGKLAKFSSTTSLTIADLTGDVTTSGTSVTTLAASIAGVHTFSGAISHNRGETLNGSFNGPTTIAQLKSAANVRYIDPLNSQGWSGATVGAWINAAIAAVGGDPGVCGTVHLAAGIYNFGTKDSVGMATCINVIGEGIGKTILNGLSLTTGNHMFSSTNKTDWTVAEMTLVGPSPSGATDVRGISAVGCTRCIAYHLRVTNCSDGIDMLGNAPTSNDNIIRENYITSMSNQGSAVLGDRNQITFNHIDTVGTTNLHHGIYLQQGTGNEVVGNQIFSVFGFCIHNFSQTTSASIVASRIIGNFCNAGGEAGSGTRGGIAFAESAPATGTRSGEVQGNTIENTAGGTSIYISATNEVIVAQNTVRNYQGDCVDLQGSFGFKAARLIFANNVCFGGTVSGVAAVNVLPNFGNIQNVTVSDNIIDTTFGAGILVQTCTDCIVSRNRVKDYNLQGAFGNAGISIGASSLRVNVFGNSVSTVNTTGSPNAIYIPDAGTTDTVVYGNMILNFGVGSAVGNAGTRTLIWGNHTQSNNPLMEIAK
jgi:hypothetical protein